MYCRFPIELLALLRCAHDGGRLSADASQGSIGDGEVRCDGCGRRYRISGGILSLLDPTALDGESAVEMRVRDEQAGGADAYIAALGPVDTAEMIPTLEELQPLAGTTVLELGCGTGRYTVPVLKEARALLATDFSRGALAALARKLPDDERVGLVQADVTRFATVAGAFDRVLSTLVSNLPTDAHREAMYRMGARALRGDGRFVFSTHNLGLRERILREPREGPYSREYPVYRRLFTAADIVGEARRHFDRVRCRRVQNVLPFSRRFPFPIVAFSRAVERVPGLNQLARILLVTAERPAATEAVPAPSAAASAGS